MPYNDHSLARATSPDRRMWHVPIGGGSPTQQTPAMGSVVEYWRNRGRGMARELPQLRRRAQLARSASGSRAIPRPGEHAGWLGRR